MEVGSKNRSPELMALATSLYKKSGSGNAVAKKLGVSAGTAYRILRAAGISVPAWSDEKPLRRKLTDEKAAQVVSDYVSGMGLVELRAKHGVSDWSVRAYVKRAGVALRDIGGRKRRVTEGDADEMVRLSRECNLTQTQIATQFSCNQATVSKALKSRGVASSSHASGAEHGSWRGGIISAQGGYIKEMISSGDIFAAMRGRNGYVFQHRLVMARALGRVLHPSETVHHINGNVADNRIENLQLRQGRHGNGIRHVCAECGSHNVVEAKL